MTRQYVPKQAREHLLQTSMAVQDPIRIYGIGTEHQRASLQAPLIPVLYRPMPISIV